MVNMSSVTRATANIATGGRSFEGRQTVVGVTIFADIRREKY